MAQAGTPQDFILTLSCEDKPGIVAAVAGSLAEMGANIEESSQFGDADTGRFFMRIRFADLERRGLPVLWDGLMPAARRFTMSWNLSAAARRPRVLILVSKSDHCLNDLRCDGVRAVDRPIYF